MKGIYKNFSAVLILLLGVTFPLMSKGSLQLGIDVLQANHFKSLKNYKKIGVLTHNPSTDSRNTPTAEIFAKQQAKGGELEYTGAYLIPFLHGMTIGELANKLVHIIIHINAKVIFDIKNEQLYSNSEALEA